MDKNTNEFYEGSDALGILGHDTTYDIKIRPQSFNNYELFIQSNSSNRKLINGQKFIYH